MFQIVLYLSLIILIHCYDYKELKKHSSVKVPPDTRVYFDLSKFDVGESIEFEITMDLSNGGYRNKYDFKIDQVSAISYISDNWASLPQETSRDVSCKSGGECTFSWEETKEVGKDYIYIIPHTPYPGYSKKIEIEHLGGGLSAGAIAGIVIGCIVFVAIIVILISCCCCRCNPGCQTSCYSCCPCCHCCSCCCPRVQYGIGGAVRPGFITGPTAVPVAVATPIYPPPVYPQPIYQPAVPYSSGAYI